MEYKSNKFNYARAFNMGAKEAKGRILIRLSGDCIPLGSAWLEQIIKSFENEKVGGVFGKYTISGRPGYTYPNFWPKSRFPKTITVYSVKPTLFIGLFGKGKYIFDFAGGCCAIRRNIWHKRPFNEKLIAAEDAEYSWFLHIIGMDILYNPNIVVLHEHKVNLTETAKAYSGINLWNIIFNLELFKYWMGKLLGYDPYRKIRFTK